MTSTSIPSHLDLTVVRASEIKWNPTYGNKLPNIYVLLQFDNVKRRTKTVKRSLTPDYDELFTFNLKSEGQWTKLNIQVKHDSSWKDRCLGEIDIEFSDLLERCANSKVMELRLNIACGPASVETAAVLHLRLEATNDLTVASRNIDAAERAIQERGIPHADLYKSVGALVSKLDVLVRVMDVLSQIHPYANFAWQLASALHEGIRCQFEVDKKVVKLVHAMRDAFDFVDQIDTLRDKTKLLETTIIQLLRQTNECCLFIQEYARHKFARRLVMLSADAMIDKFFESLQTLKSSIDSGIVAHIAFVSSRMSSRVDALYLKSQLNPDEMDAYHRPQCLPGTRTKIQKEVVEWASSCSDQNVFWLHGIAGSGKSTVSTTIAEHFRTISRLGAHLFFERGKSDPSLVIRTLAYKLALFDSAVAKHVSMAIDQDKEIARATAATQFESLIHYPLTSASDAMHGPVVIVLDALDECGLEGTRRMLLESLRKGLPSLPKQFRFLITSRKELDIVRVLSSQPDCIVPIELEHDSEACKGDVLRYIDHGMRNVLNKNELRIPADWQLRMDRLGDAAGGLFVWASTAVKLVDRDYPARRLNDLVSRLQSLSGLDDLYRTILEGSGISFDDKVSRAYFSQVLGLILLCKIPLSDDTIDGFLGYSDEESSRIILARLQSVLVYTPGAPIRFCHTSFRDYLLASERASDDWFIDLDAQRKFIASRCFDVMRHMLRFDICNIQSSYLRNDQIPDLPVRIKANVPPQLEYACVSWTQHLHETQFSHALLYELSDLLNNRLPYWLEVMSLLEKVNTASPALLHAIKWVSSHDADVLIFLKDARRMITKYLPAISQSTPHIYVTVLLFMSTESRLMARHLKPGLPIVQVKQEGIKQQSPFLKELIAHRNCVRSVTFSPDGALVASGSIDATIRIWDAESGQVISGPFEGQTECVAFSPDSTRIVSGSGNTVRIWDIEKGQIIWEPFKGHTGPVHSVAFSPDGMYVASGSTDKTIIIWNVDSGQIVSGLFEGHTGSIRSVAFSPDGQQIVSGSSDKTIRIWDVKSGQTICGPIKGHGGKVMSVAFSHDATHVVSGSEDGEIRFWDAKSGRCTSALFKRLAGGGVTSVALSPDGKRVVSGSYDRTVRIWDIESRQVVSGPFTGHTGAVWSVAFSSDGTRVASGSDDCTIRIWDAENVHPVSGRFEGHTDDVNSVAFSPNGRYVASGSDDKTIRIWDIENGYAASRPFEGHSERIWSVTFSPDGRYVASGSGDKTIRIWDVGTGRIISGPLEGHKDTVWSVSFSSDGRRIVSGSGDSTLRIWDVESGLTISGPFKGHDGLVCSVAFSNDGQRVVSGSSDKTIIIWDVKSLEVISGPLKGHSRAVRSVAFSPDSTRVVSGSDDTTILIWDVESGKVVAGPLKGHTNWIRSVAFSADGTRVVSGSGDKTIRMWDTDSGHATLAPLEGHTNSVLSVAFSPDGRRVVSGSMDHTIRMWNIEDPVFDWTLSEDGWIRGHRGELLLWIPPDQRPTLWQARNTAVFNCQFSSRLDFANAALGERWKECFAAIQ